MKPRLSEMLKTAVGFFSTRTAIISSYCGWNILPNKISSFNSFIDLRKLCKMVDAKLDAVQLVDIEEGIFKYVLIKVYGKEKSDGTESSKKIVRGYTDCQWHSDIYERVSTSCKGLGLETECLGGGRIEHNPNAKFIKVYGYSQGFGKADHAESRDILRSKYHDYEIQTSDDGY